MKKNIINNMSRLIRPRIRRGFLPSPIIVVTVLLGLFSSMSGALRLPNQLAFLSPELKIEIKSQDEGLAAGSWHGLLQKYRRLLTKGDAPAYVHFLVGRVYSRIGLYQAAKAELEECLELTPRHFPALSCLGSCLVRLHKLDEAERVLNIAAAIAPEKADVLLTRAAVHVQRGYPERALPLLEKAHRLGGGRNVVLQQALCLYQTGRLAQSANLLSRLLLSEPRLGAARELLALVFIRQGRFHEAHDQLSRVGRRGAVGTRCAKFAKIVRRVIRGQLSEGAAVAYFQAQALPRGKVEERNELLSEAKSEDFPEVLIELSLSKLKSDKQGALALLERACASQHASDEALFRLGMLLHDLGNKERATEVLKRAADANPSNPEVRIRLGLLLAEANETDEALRHYRRAIHLSPTDPRPYSMAGMLLAKSGKTNNACDYLREALLLNPFDDEAAQMLCKLES